jgi:hypothetical protein
MLAAPDALPKQRGRYPLCSHMDEPERRNFRECVNCFTHLVVTVAYLRFIDRARSIRDRCSAGGS